MEDIDEKINKHNQKTGEEIARSHRVLSISDIIKEECKPIEFILEPWFNKQGLVMVFAERGVGKTHFSLNTAHAIARGGEFLKWEAPAARKVLYIDGEMPFFAVKERILAMNKMYGFDPEIDNLRLITPDKYNRTIPDLSSTQGQNEVDQIIDEENIEVVIIDNIACLMPKIKGNDNDSWNTMIQGWLLSLRRRNVGVMIVHHAGKPKKDEKSSGRGSSGKEDILDTVISLSRPLGYNASDGARFIVEFTKNRHFYGDDAEPLEAWLKNDSNGEPFWSRDNIIESTYSQVCTMMNDGMRQSEIAAKLKISRQRVSKLVQKGYEQQKITIFNDSFSVKS